eukprot:1550865-Rhodomonas_salina.6
MRSTVGGSSTGGSALRICHPGCGTPAAPSTAIRALRQYRAAHSKGYRTARSKRAVHAMSASDIA